MKSVDYNSVVKWLEGKELPITIPTLGRRSVTKVTLEDKKIHVIGSKGGEWTWEQDRWKAVCEYIDTLSVTEKERAKKYGDILPHQFAPSVAAICRAYCEEHKYGR